MPFISGTALCSQDRWSRDVQATQFPGDDKEKHMSDVTPVEPQSAPDAAPVAADPTPEAPAAPVSVHPTGVDLPDSEVQGPTGAVTDEDDLPGDNVELPEPAFELVDQVEPLDEPNGGQ